MKTRIVTAWALALLSAAGAWGQVKINLDERAKPTEQTDPNKPAEKAAPKKDDKKKKEDDKPGKIEGMEIKHGDGYMGLQIKNSMFTLAFYDAKKKPVEPDVARAALRWQPEYQRQPERIMLERSGKVLTSERTIRPPYHFRLFITLFKTDSDSFEVPNSTVENLTVEFAQP